MRSKKTSNKRSQSFVKRHRLDRNFDLYLMLIPVIAFYFIFRYVPLYGIQIAFKDFRPTLGITDSPWLDNPLGNFITFISSPYFYRLIRNTLKISLFNLLFGFPLPIIIALMINEVKNKKFQKTVQNITYAPYFLSIIVVVGIMRSFLNRDYGLLNMFYTSFGGTARNWLQMPEAFLPSYIISGIWQSTGWDAIIYISALAGVSQELHEAAQIDGASRLKRIWHINIPSILPTIVILLILRFGGLMSVGFEKVFLMQNDLNMEVSDVISTYTYRIGIQGAQFSYATAIDVFNSLINFALLVIVNQISRRVGETSLW